MPNVLNPRYWHNNHPHLLTWMKIISIPFRIIIFLAIAIGWITILFADWPYLSLMNIVMIIWFLLASVTTNKHISKRINHIRLAWKHSIQPNSRYQQLAYHISIMAYGIFIIIGLIAGLIEAFHLIWLTGLHISILHRLNKAYAILGKWISVYL